MTLTLLLDLDDTLLNTNLEAFVPAYFQALAKHLAPHVPPDAMLGALISGMRLMNESDDFSRTLSDVFYAEFYPKLGLQNEALKPFIEDFYDNVFPDLSNLTSPRPDAKEFVTWARSKGFRIGIATDPLLPGKATLHRLRWAGFDPHEFELVSSFESFHFSKTHPAYYAEFLGRMGWPDGPILMVGNDIDRDIEPAKKLGLATYLVDGEPGSNPDPEPGVRGSLTDLRLWLESVELETLMPSFKSIESIMSILIATPASLRGLFFDVDNVKWAEKGTKDEWSLIELICHLRDIEREVHQMQIKLFESKVDPFIPRPDTSVWSSQRDYLHDDGPAALESYIEARRETLEILRKLSEVDWQRKARHAIFGPTNFMEIISFIARHDGMHLQQAWNILHKK